MKTALFRLFGVIGIACLGVSCTTTYDAQGRPVQSVSPEGAAIAAVAAGVIGYAIADGNDNNYYYGRRGHGHHGGYPGGRYCR